MICLPVASPKISPRNSSATHPGFTKLPSTHSSQVSPKPVRNCSSDCLETHFTHFSTYGRSCFTETEGVKSLITFLIWFCFSAFFDNEFSFNVYRPFVDDSAPYKCCKAPTGQTAYADCHFNLFLHTVVLQDTTSITVHATTCRPTTSRPPRRISMY